MQFDLELVLWNQMRCHVLNRFVCINCEFPQTLPQLDKDLIIIEQRVVQTLPVELKDLVDDRRQGDGLVNFRLLIACSSVDLGTHV